jgi:hypothetical protein
MTPLASPPALPGRPGLSSRPPRRARGQRQALDPVAPRPVRDRRRTRARKREPLKAWKLTAEDWRNRGKRREYEVAVEEMLDRTDHAAAPWVLVEAEDKRWARVKVVESVVEAIETGMAARDILVPPAPPADAARTA